MKGLYKKISAIALAGMVVLGGGVLGGALGGVQKVDAVSWLAVQMQGEQDVKDLARKYELQIWYKGSKEEVNKFVEKQFEKQFLRKRLSKPQGIFEHKAELEKYIQKIRYEDKKQFYRIRYQKGEYIIRIKR